MIDWTLLFIQFIFSVTSGFIGFFLGMWFFNKYFLPKMTPQMGKDMIKALKDMPEIKDLVKRANGLMDQFEPLMEKVKNIDPVKVEEAVKAITDLASNVAKKFEKPEIPEPD